MTSVSGSDHPQPLSATRLDDGKDLMTDTPPAPAVRRTTAHNHAQLADALGWTLLQVDKAVVLGMLPAYDLKTPRWTAATVATILDQAAELTAEVAAAALLTDGEMLALLGLEYGEWRRARDHDVIPDPDRGEFWTRQLAEDLKARIEQLRERIPPQPLGVRRCAELLAELTELEATTDDVEALIEQGHITAVDWFKNWPLYDVGDVRRLGTTTDGQQLVAAIVTDRQAWLANSVTAEVAARRLGWYRRDLERAADEHGITPGRFGRWAGVDVARLSGDEELMERVRRGRLLGPEQAAEYMQIRRVDLAYVLAAGWVAPVDSATREVGVSKTVQVPLYAVGDLDDALQVPGVDWEAVRAVRPGEVSPLREHTRLPARRAEVVRAFCVQLGDEWAVEVWPQWWNAGDLWEIDWEQRADGHPTVGEVAAALAAHRGASRHADRIRLSTAVGEVIRQARADLEPAAAVVLDTETTDLDGVVIEIAVLDAATGAVLLDTLVSPDGVPIEVGARAVHGISDADLTGAPRWADVLPAFLAAVDGRRILAYNADFDRGAITATHVRAGLDVTELPAEGRWGCLMAAQSAWLRTDWRFRLGGGHRARGDAEAARQVLQRLASPLSGPSRR